MGVLTPGTGGIVGPTSITIIKRDPLPSLPSGLSAIERLRRFTEAIALVASPLKNKDKWRADVAMSQSHDRKMFITRNPVERGFKSTDHMRREPDTLSFNGLISDSPFLPLGFPTFQNRAHDQFRRLNQFFEAREPVFVASSLRVYESMGIASINSSRDADTGGAIEVSITFTEIRIEEEVLGDRLIDDAASQYGANAPTDGGTQALF